MKPLKCAHAKVKKVDESLEFHETWFEFICLRWAPCTREAQRRRSARKHKHNKFSSIQYIKLEMLATRPTSRAIFLKRETSIATDPDVFSGYGVTSSASHALGHGTCKSKHAPMMVPHAAYLVSVIAFQLSEWSPSTACLYIGCSHCLARATVENALARLDKSQLVIAFVPVAAAHSGRSQ